MMLARFFILLCLAALSMPGKASDIDAILSQHWESQKVTPPAAIDDHTFLRRVYLDVVGRIPNHTESTAFLADSSKDKRSRLIDQLLASEGYVQHFMNYWADVLRIKALPATYVATPYYFNWLRDALRQNKPYDVMVRDLLGAQGYVTQDPAIGFWFRDAGMPLDRFAIISRTFLGTRVECAQCHDHPFDKWTQKQFYEMAAFTYSVEPGLFNGGNYNALYWNGSKRFGVDSRIGPKMEGAINALYEPLFGNRLRINPGLKLKYPHDYQYDNAKPNETAGMGVFFGRMPEAGDPLKRQAAFASWVTDPETTRFRTVIVSRLVQRVFGRALIEPLDDLRDTSSASVPALQKHLEEQLTAMNYNMRAFLRLLLNSRAYQSAARPIAQPGEDYHFNGPLTRRLTAEQIWDSLITLVNPEPDRPNLVRLETENIHAGRIALLEDILYKLPDKDIWEKLKVMATWITESQEQGLKLAAEREQAREAKNDKRVREIDAQLEERRNSKQKHVLQDVLLPLARQRYGDQMPRPERFEKIYGMPWSNWNQIDPPADLVAAGHADAARIGLDERRIDQYINKRREWNMGFCRASERRQPDTPGSILRNLGQSDRELVENANSQPAIPHALDLLNDGHLLEQLTHTYAALRIGLAQSRTPAEKLRALMLTLFVREPTAAEVDRLLPLIGEPEGLEDLILAAITTKEFIYQQ